MLLKSFIELFTKTYNGKNFNSYKRYTFELYKELLFNFLYTSEKYCRSYINLNYRDV